MPKMDLSQNYRFGNKLYRAGRDVEIPADLYAALNLKDESAVNRNADDAERTAMPYAELLIPKHFADEDAIDAASDEDLLAIDGVGPKRLAEIREYFGQ
jgi:predicted flap endonuclease-1-like 5' DNA nuclease